VLYGVFASYIIVPSRGRVSIYNLILSFNNTTSRFNRASLAPQNPAQTFNNIKVLKKASLKASRKVSLLI
jgi:hypothetical protein